MRSTLTRVLRLHAFQHRILDIDARPSRDTIQDAMVSSLSLPELNHSS
jgi:hypothetical protein